ncbi:MAG: hypothetical protein Rubg2KO_28200 [Rubricoccaceae bacterium]
MRLAAMTTHVHLDLMGGDFSPSKAEQATGVTLHKKREVGDIGERGRYRGQPIPYGSATLDAPLSVNRGDKLSWVLGAALQHIETFRQLGADNIKVWIVEYFEPGGQMNMAYRPDELAKLGRLGVPLWVSGYETEQDLEV